MSDEERPRKSWREIDRGRDRSRHRSEAPASGQEGRKRGPGSQKSYRAALDRVFSSGKIGEIVAARTGSPLPDQEEGEHRLKLLQRIKSATGRDAISKELDAYLERYPLPDDLEILEKALEHRSSSRQLEALKRIESLLEGGEQPKRKRGMVGQLKMIRDLGEDAELQTLASQLLTRLE